MAVQPDAPLSHRVREGSRLDEAARDGGVRDHLENGFQVVSEEVVEGPAEALLVTPAARSATG